jgi:hypothetical protein
MFAGGPCFAEACRLASYSAFAHVQAAVHEGEVSGVKPDSGLQSDPSDSGVPTQHRCTTCNIQRANFNVQLASMRRATCMKCHGQLATNMVAAMQHMIRCMSTPALSVVCVFGTP